MKTPVDEQLIAEIKAFELRFCCDHCAHGMPESVSHSSREGGLRCSLLYPIGERVRPLAAGDLLVFCKEFELD
jgi:hypothetical protein